MHLLCTYMLLHKVLCIWCCALRIYSSYCMQVELAHVHSILVYYMNTTCQMQAITYFTCEMHVVQALNTCAPRTKGMCTRIGIHALCMQNTWSKSSLIASKLESCPVNTYIISSSTLHSTLCPSQTTGKLPIKHVHAK